MDADKAYNRPFHVYYSFTITPNSGADAGAGMSFLMQNNDVGQTGASGEGMGYGGISTSLAIEFDTHKYVPPKGNANYPDPEGHHIGFMLDGKYEEHPALINLQDTDFSSLTGKRMYVWIDYAGMGSNQVLLYMSTTKQKPDEPLTWHANKAPAPILPTAVYPDDFDADNWISVEMDSKPPQAWVGFSAATGSGITNDHIVEEWEFSNEGVPCACQEVGYCATLDPKKPACGSDTGLCVECNVNKDCSQENPICTSATHTCGDCTTNADCSRFPDNPVCDIEEGSPTKGACIACPEGEAYNASTGKCVPVPPLDPDCLENPAACDDSCKIDADCPASLLCNAQTNLAATEMAEGAPDAPSAPMAYPGRGAAPAAF